MATRSSFHFEGSLDRIPFWRLLGLQSSKMLIFPWRAMGNRCGRGAQGAGKHRKSKGFGVALEFVQLGHVVEVVLVLRVRNHAQQKDPALGICQRSTQEGENHGEPEINHREHQAGVVSVDHKVRGSCSQLSLAKEASRNAEQKCVHDHVIAHSLGPGPQCRFCVSYWTPA